MIGPFLEITSRATINKPAPKDWKFAIEQKTGLKILEISWLAGDGSDRSYYRITLADNEKTLVLMQLADKDFTALKKNKYEWVEIEAILNKHNILTPRPLHTLQELGLLIIEDYGNQMLESLFLNKELNSADVMKNIKPALDLILKMQTISKTNSECWTQRSFDYDRFMWELRFFKKNFVEGVLQYKFNRKENDLFLQEADSLSKNLADLPQVFTHRDFHSRNIMVTEDENLYALIDFQDARLGPACYDFVSLVFDSYLPLSKEQRVNLFEASCSYLIEQTSNHMFDNVKPQSLIMLVQRQLKAIGSFGYLKIEKNKPLYLDYVLPAVSTIEPLDAFPFLTKELPKIVKKHFQN